MSGLRWHKKSDLNLRLFSAVTAFLLYCSVTQSCLTLCDPRNGLCCAVLSHSVMSDCDPMDCSSPGSSFQGDSPGKNIGAGCQALLQGIFPTQEWNWGLLLCRRILYQLSYQASPSNSLRLCSLEVPGI